MASREGLGTIPLTVGTKAIRARYKPVTKVQRSLEFVFGSLFAGMVIWHLLRPENKLWSLFYAAAALISVLPARTITQLWFNGAASTAFGFSLFVLSGVAGQKPEVDFFSPDAMASLVAALWFGSRFVVELRDTKATDRIGDGPQEFINLRKLKR